MITYYIKPYVKTIPPMIDLERSPLAFMFRTAWKIEYFQMFSLFRFFMPRDMFPSPKWDGMQEEQMLHISWPTIRLNKKAWANMNS